MRNKSRNRNWRLVLLCNVPAAILSLKPHPKSLSGGRGTSAPFSSGEGLGMRPKLHRSIKKFKHDEVGLDTEGWSLRVITGSIFILLFLAISSSCSKTSEQIQAEEYTCPMHPSVLQDKPGTCPICAMDLVKKGQQGQEIKMTAELNYLLKPTNAMVISAIKTVMPVKKSMEIVTNANGITTYDTRRFTSIPIRFGGRIERLFIRYNFQPIRKGQKVLEIYSPELVTAQRDLVYLLKSDKENLGLIEAAKQKLMLLGVSDSQINQLASTGQESYSIAVFSPVDGYIVEDGSLLPKLQGQAPDAAPMNGGGSSSNAQQPLTSLPSGELLTREGAYVSAGQVLFKVVNTDYLWAEFDVYQRDAALIKVNGAVKISIENTNEVIDAKINLVQPFFNGGESFTKVRVYLSNQGNKFQAGQLVTASFFTSSKDSMWIPRSAQFDLGSKIIAFVKKRGVFRPKVIVTAGQSGEWVEVSEGLNAGDSIAYNAQFMIDSESFIKVRN